VLHWSAECCIEVYSAVYGCAVLYREVYSVAEGCIVVLQWCQVLYRGVQCFIGV